MLSKRIEQLKQEKIRLKEQAEILHTKMTIASASCSIAAETHYLKLMQTNSTYLDIDEELQELLKVPANPTTPSNIVEDQAVS